MPVPPALLKWFAATYPQVRFNDEWLQGCVDYIQENFAPTAQGLIKKVETQLLLSNLSESTLHHAGLLPPDSSDEVSTVLFSRKQDAVLVQVLEVVEIGHPALQLLDIHKTRREAKKIFEEHGRVMRRAISLAPTQTQGTEVDDEAKPETDNTDAKGFPRSMLKVRLSDGYSTYEAIEYKRVGGLSMEDTQLGRKLLLKNIECRRGILLLSEQACTVKGGAIAALEAQRDELLEETLTRLVHGDTGTAPRAPLAHQRHPAQVPARQANGTRASSSKPTSNKKIKTSTAPSSNKGKISTARKDAQDENDYEAMMEDDLLDDDDLAALQEIEQSQPKPKAFKQQAPRDSKGKARMTEIDELAGDEDEMEMLQALEEAEASKRNGPASRQQSRPITAVGKVIDIDESSDEDEKTGQEAGALAPQRHTAGKAGGSRQSRTDNYIEIDSD